jgi:hypothetical protein
MIIENCDFFEETLIDVMQVLNELIHNENRNHEDMKRIRNILDDLDNFNITFILEDIDMIQYTMLLSMKHASIGIIDKDEISFKELVFPNDEMEKDYIRLITQSVEIHNLLKDKYNFPVEEIEYIYPNSKLMTVRVSLSIKDLLYFILSCGKYNETIDLNLVFSDYDNLTEIIVTVAMSLTDMIKVDDLFIRMKLDEENRGIILDSTTMNINIVSNEEYIDYCIKTNNVEVKLSTIGACSLVAYRYIVNNLPKQDIKIENFNDFIDQEYYGIILPKNYTEIEGDDANLIDGYIYDWYLLVNKYKEFSEYEHEQILCCLGCFTNIFKMNTPIYNYFELDAQGLFEVEELMNVVQNKLIH